MPDDKRRRARAGKAGRGRPPNPRRRARLEHFLAQAYAHHQRREFELALAAYDEVLKIDPGHVDALQHSAPLMVRMGRPQAAMTRLEAALHLLPDSDAMHALIGNIRREMGDLDAAVRAYMRALELNPGAALTLYNLGSTLRLMGLVDEALVAFDRLVALSPDDARAWAGRAGALMDVGRSVDARQALEHALQLDPTLADVHNELGNVLMDLGDFEAAAAAFRRALQLAPGLTKAYLNLTRTRRIIDASDPLVTELDDVLSTTRAVDQRCDLHFALGKVHDDLGDHASAVRHYRLANDAGRSLVRYDAARYRAEVDTLQRSFSAELFQRPDLAAAGSDSRQPVFVVGMPRSASTLVERIIASHDQAQSGGELPFIAMLVRDLVEARPIDEALLAAVARLDADAVQAAAARYLQWLGGRGLQAARVVDKALINLNYLGLVRLLFPRAAVIYCQRDALDVCLSLYFLHLPGSQPYCYDLGQLAERYVAHEQLLAHWQRLFPGWIHTVRYQDLVRDQEPTSRALLEATALEWDERCLQFHQHGGAVRTASNWQVRRPVYDSSLGRWQRYGELAAEMDAALAAARAQVQRA